MALKHAGGRADLFCACFVGVLVVGSVGCRNDEPSTGSTTVALATGPSGSIYDEIGTALVENYSKILDLRVSVRETQGSVARLEEIQRGNVDVALVRADAAYQAYKKRSAEFRTRVRGIAVLYVNAVQLFVRTDSPIRTVGDFRRRRVSVGRLGPGGPTDLAVRVILDSYGVPVSEVDLESNGQLTMDEFVSELRNREVDIGVLTTGYPVLPLATPINNVGMRLVPLDANKIDQIRLRYRFFKPIVIPSGTYPGQEADVQTIGIDTLLVCREDLPEELVHKLTRAFFESLPELRKRHRAADLIDPEQGPATSVPLHPGASRFYRERELRRLTPIALRPLG